MFVRYAHFLLVFYEFYEPMTRGGDKPGWVYVPVIVINPSQKRSKVNTALCERAENEKF